MENQELKDLIISLGGEVVDGEDKLFAGTHVEVDLDKLYALQFKNADKIIPTFTAEKKLQFAVTISDIILPPLYEGASLYRDGIPKPDQIYISPENFVRLMGKIKHWEAILQMLYNNNAFDDIDLDMEV